MTIVTRTPHKLPCHLNFRPFLGRVFYRIISWLDEEFWLEGNEVHRRAKGARYQAERRRHVGGVGLPQGGDQLDDLLQLEEEIRRADAMRDAAAACSATLWMGD